MKKVVLLISIITCSYISNGADPVQVENQSNILAAGNGRYVFGKADGIEYMLDTQTGRLWFERFYEGNDRFILMPVPYQADDASLQIFPPKQDDDDKNLTLPIVNSNNGASGTTSTPYVAPIPKP